MKPSDGDLLRNITEKIKAVRTKSLDISFNEILDMYESEELKIDPDYQRLFRWTTVQQSRFIESIILEMPVPPIYAIESETGKYELIDGLQRISSYINFRGQLKSSQESQTDGALVLEGCDIVKSLNGLTFEELPSPIKIRLKRNFVRLEILRAESDQRLKYYMFKRLNTGGEPLSQQEIRNCTVKLGEPKFHNFMAELAGAESFKACIAALSEDELDKKYDQELVLRFFAIKNWPEKYSKDVSDFLTRYMEGISNLSEDTILAFDIPSEKVIFDKTFRAYAMVLGEGAFTKLKRDGNPGAKFMVYHYEALTIGIQDYLDQVLSLNTLKSQELRDRILDLKRSPQFDEVVSGGGKNTFTQLSKRADLVRDMYAEFFS